VDFEEEFAGAGIDVIEFATVLLSGGLSDVVFGVLGCAEVLDDGEAPNGLFNV